MHFISGQGYFQNLSHNLFTKLQEAFSIYLAIASPSVSPEWSFQFSAFMAVLFLLTFAIRGGQYTNMTDHFDI